jgi:hypothetical protein
MSTEMQLQAIAMDREIEARRASRAAEARALSLADRSVSGAPSGVVLRAGSLLERGWARARGMWRQDGGRDVGQSY